MGEVSVKQAMKDMIETMEQSMKDRIEVSMLINPSVTREVITKFLEKHGEGLKCVECTEASCGFYKLAEYLRVKAVGRLNEVEIIKLNQMLKLGAEYDELKKQRDELKAEYEKAVIRAKEAYKALKREHTELWDMVVISHSLSKAAHRMNPNTYDIEFSIKGAEINE